MKHAGPEALNVLEPLLVRIRKHEQLREKKRGLFYRKGKSFLHFHEDPTGLFADLCAGGEDSRLRVGTQAEQNVLLARIRQALAD